VTTLFKFGLPFGLRLDLLEGTAAEARAYIALQSGRGPRLGNGLPPAP